MSGNLFNYLLMAFVIVILLLVIYLTYVFVQAKDKVIKNYNRFRNESLKGKISRVSKFLLKPSKSKFTPEQIASTARMQMSTVMDQMQEGGNSMNDLSPAKKEQDLPWMNGLYTGYDVGIPYLNIMSYGDRFITYNGNSPKFQPFKKGAKCCPRWNENACVPENQYTPCGCGPVKSAGTYGSRVLMEASDDTYMGRLSAPGSTAINDSLADIRN